MTTTMSGRMAVVTMAAMGLLLPIAVHAWAYPDFAEGHEGRHGGQRATAPPGPHFVTVPSDRNVTTTLGQTAYLTCRVAHLAEETQVSWIRKHDLRVLSSGVVVFASDQRFQVVHPTGTDRWTLQIKYAQVRDAGTYECQVNTVPKISQAYVLSVVEARASIHGPEYVKAGSTINLTCYINQPLEQGLVHWYHNNNMLDYEGPVSITTHGDLTSTVSRLTITEASPQHSGNYTCWPSSAHFASIVINVVVEGEQPAAMQTGSGVTVSSCLLAPIALLQLLILVLNHAHNHAHR